MKFDLNNFRFVSDLGLGNGWANIGLEQLQGYTAYLEKEGFTEADMPDVFKAVNQSGVFLSAISSDLIGEDEPDQIVSAYSEQGVLDRVNGPCFWQSDEGDAIVLRVGTTLYNAKIEDEKIVVGKLKGSVEVSELKGADDKVVTNDNGDPVLRVTAKLRDPKDRSKGAEVFYIPLMLDKEAQVTEAQLLGAIEDGDIHQYLAPIPKGGGNFFDLRMLPQGDYLVTDISDKKEIEWNGKIITSWNLTIDGLGMVSSRGKNLEGQLETSGKILQKVARTRGITLRVSKHDVEYTTLDGEEKNVPFPNFCVDLKNGNVKNLPEGKVGNSDVKHYMNVGILKDYQTETIPTLIEMAMGVKKLAGGSTTQATLPAVPEPAAIAAKAEVVDEYEGVEF